MNNSILGNDGKEGVTYWGWVNHGVSSTVKQASNPIIPDTSDNVRITYSRSHAGDVDNIVESAYDGSKIKIEKIVSAGSGYKSIRVVQNEADVYLHTTRIKKWDTCAGNAIVNAVGGAMTDLKGQQIKYGAQSDAYLLGGLIAAKKSKVYDDLLHRLKKTQ